MAGQERLIYLWDGAEWVKALGDAAGHFQVDILSAPALVNHIYGYDGAAWQTILVESAANPNLRARLYDGVNPVVSVGTAADIAATNRGLFTQAGVRGWDGTFWKSVNIEDGAGDALTNARACLSAVSKLYGYNGATWDRLRTYLTGILKVARAETDAVTVRVTGVGQVIAGDRYLYWIDCNPAAGNSVWELTDAIIALQAIVLDHFHTGREGHIMTLDPPMHFTTGIYLETFTNMTSMVFCYR